MVRDFFWDDEFRQKWDDMLVNAQTLEECPTTGTMTVHWVRKVSEACFCHPYLLILFVLFSHCFYVCAVPFLL